MDMVRGWIVKVNGAPLKNIGNGGLPGTTLTLERIMLFPSYKAASAVARGLEESTAVMEQECDIQVIQVDLPGNLVAQRKRVFNA